jgi:chemotaxis family two-component system response regulator Rcp1
LAPIEILLVEDSPEAAHLTIEALRDPKVNYHVQVVEDGEEALHFLHREEPHLSAPRPDLIFLDLNLPKIDGRKVLATIKAEENLMDIPVIVLTCSSNPADVEDAYRHQVAAYITKPAGLDEYFAAIRSLTQLWFNRITLPKTARENALGSLTE